MSTLRPLIFAFISGSAPLVRLMNNAETIYVFRDSVPQLVYRLSVRFFLRALETNQRAPNIPIHIEEYHFTSEGNCVGLLPEAACVSSLPS